MHFIMALLAIFLAGCGQVIRTSTANDFFAQQSDGALMSYAFARGEFTITASYAAKPKLLTISSDPQIRALPDFNHKHTLAYTHGPLSTDEVDIILDNGILKTVSSTTQDQSIEAIKAVNTLLTQVASTQTALNPPVHKALVVNTPPPETYKYPCTADEDIKVNRIVDLTYHKTGVLVIQQASSTCSVRLSVNYVKLKSVFGLAGFPNNYEESPTERICDEAVCFRLAGAYEVSATAALYNGKDPVLGADKKPVVTTTKVQMFAPVHGAVGFVHFKRRAFVTNSTKINFVNGMVSEFYAKNPSELVGFLSLPSTVLNSVVLTVPLVK